MAYSLNQALVEVKYPLSWLTQPIDMEPLDGLFDGTSRVFHARSTPMSTSDPVALYDYDLAPVSSGSYTVVNYDSGTLAFTVPPAKQVYASYTQQSLTDTFLLGVCREGFADMQSRYPRPLWLVSDGGSTYVSGDPATVTDPIMGASTLPFSQSNIQTGFLTRCCAYSLYRSMQANAALGSMVYREERVGGLSVDTSKRSGDLRALVEAMNERANEAMKAVYREENPTGAYGSFVPGAQSDLYKYGYEWWSHSEQANGGS